MQKRCIVVRILPGRGEAARELVSELAGSRRAEQELSARSIGARVASWSLGGPAEGKLLIGTIDSHDLGHALSLFAVSLAPHDLWFKRRFADVTGVNLNEPQTIVAGDTPGDAVLRASAAVG